MKNITRFLSRNNLCKERRAFLLSSGMLGLSAVTLGPKVAQGKEKDASNSLTRGMIPTTKGYLHYRRMGRGQPILLLHVLPFSSEMYDALIPFLSEKFDCIAIDLMGYGQSDLRTHEWTTEEHTQNIREALDFLGINEPIIVLGGHFTATIAAELALEGLVRVSHLVMDGVILDPNYQAAGPNNTDRVTANSVSAAFDLGIELIKRFNPDLTKEELKSRKIAKFAMLFTRAAALRGALATPYDMAAKLPGVEQPTLIIGSPTDNLRGNHERALALLRNGSGFVFDDINPIYQFHRPDRAHEYATVLESFVFG